MPTAALIERSGALLKHRQGLWKVSQGGKTGDWSQALRESDDDLESFRRDVAEHHRLEAAKLADWNDRLQRRHALAGD